jgi:hypothetical protein
LKVDSVLAAPLHALKQHYAGKLRLTDVEGDVPADEGSWLGCEAAKILLGHDEKPTLHRQHGEKMS